jgi:hypothetical protein
VSPPPDRPLRLGELFAETVHLYRARLWAALGLGGVVAGTLLLAFLTGNVVGFVVLGALGFTAAFGAAARLAAGDPFVEAWAQVGVRAPVLLVLAFVVAVPFTLGRIDPILLLLAVAWLAFTGFSIPVAVLERDPEATNWFGRLAFALYRSVVLARAEYLHALGVAAALVLVYLLFGNVLERALIGFADNTSLTATLLVQVVLAPFFFLGLSVLYFEQRARAAARPAAGRTPESRSDT